MFLDIVTINWQMSGAQSDWPQQNWDDLMFGIT